MLLFAGLASAQDMYTGVWPSGTGGHYLWLGVSWADFNTKSSQLGGQNLRLINIKTGESSGPIPFKRAAVTGS